MPFGVVVQFINGRASARDARRDLNSNRRQNSKFEHSNRRDGTSNHFHVGRHQTLPIDIPIGDTSHVNTPNITLLRSLPILFHTFNRERSRSVRKFRDTREERELRLVGLVVMPRRESGARRATHQSGEAGLGGCERWVSQWMSGVRSLLPVPSVVRSGADMSRTASETSHYCHVHGRRVWSGRQCAVLHVVPTVSTDT